MELLYRQSVMFPPSARIQERSVCAKLGRKSYEPPWRTLEVESIEDWWGLFALKQSTYGTPMFKKTGLVVLDGDTVLCQVCYYKESVAVEKESGEWVWTRSRKKAFDPYTPSVSAPHSCKVNNNFCGKCRIQWQTDQMSANKGMPVFT